MRSHRTFRELDPSTFDIEVDDGAVHIHERWSGAATWRF
jgi:hypothetical protein